MTASLFMTSNKLDNNKYSRAPFPWFGGKSTVAHIVWDRFGDVEHYIEPFVGSLAVWLGRPGHFEGRTGTVNDIDGFIVNFWRAVALSPEDVAHYADIPVHESELHARHAWLIGQREGLVPRLEGNPDFYDAKIAGWWVWGVCSWIGSGFCAHIGPWHVENGRLVRTGEPGGIRRQLPQLGSHGHGINALAVDRSDLHSWFSVLSERLRYVRVACGDWSRIVTNSVLRLGQTAVFLDPPYGDDARRSSELYTYDDGSISTRVHDWCVANGDRKNLRIALCGYEGGIHDRLVDLGWDEYAWKAQGGYGAGRGGLGEANATRERIWFSPHCLKPGVDALFTMGR